MIKHIIVPIRSGHEPKPELNDHEVRVVLYTLITHKLDESNNIIERATSGLKFIQLPPWDEQNRIAGNTVTQQILTEWIEQSVDIEAVKLENIGKLTPV